MSDFITFSAEDAQNIVSLISNGSKETAIDLINSKLNSTLKNPMVFDNDSNLDDDFIMNIVKRKFAFSDCLKVYVSEANYCFVTIWDGISASSWMAADIDKNSNFTLRVLL